MGREGLFAGDRHGRKVTGKEVYGLAVCVLSMLIDTNVTQITAEIQPRPPVEVGDCAML